MCRWEFVAAFLQGELLDNEVLYCSMPSGYATGLEPSDPSSGDTVLRIEKPIYGMTQAGQRWQRTLFPYTSLARASSPPSATRACSPSARPSTVQTPSGPRKETLIIGCYVDDLFALYSHDDEHSIYHSFTERLAACTVPRAPSLSSICATRPNPNLRGF